jgi:hypothetical protein
MISSNDYIYIKRNAYVKYVIKNQQQNIIF